MTLLLEGVAGESAQLMVDIAEQLIPSRERFLGYVRSRVSDPHMAEDILQDSLLKALNKAPEIRDEERLIPWFYRILHNAIVDAYRRRNVATRLTDLSEAEDVPVPEEDDAELCACFRELLPTLKPEYAEVIEADLGEETSGKAQAQALGITGTNLKVRRHRARQALRRRLEETCRTCAEHGCLDCTCRSVSH